MNGMTCNLQICDHCKSYTSGGREKKATKKRGRPSDPDRITTVKSVKEVQPASFYPPFLPPQYSDVHSSLICCVSLEVLNRPVLLPCNELVCGPCCSQWVAVSGGVSCPGCYGCCMETQGVREPLSAVMQMLGVIVVLLEISFIHETYKCCQHFDQIALVFIRAVYNNTRSIHLLIHSL